MKVKAALTMIVNLPPRSDWVKTRGKSSIFHIPASAVEILGSKAVCHPTRSKSNGTRKARSGLPPAMTFPDLRLARTLSRLLSKTPQCRPRIARRERPDRGGSRRGALRHHGRTHRIRPARGLSGGRELHSASQGNSAAVRSHLCPSRQGRSRDLGTQPRQQPSVHGRRSHQVTPLGRLHAEAGRHRRGALKQSLPVGTGASASGAR